MCVWGERWLKEQKNTIIRNKRGENDFSAWSWRIGSLKILLMNLYYKKRIKTKMSHNFMLQISSLDILNNTNKSNVWAKTENPSAHKEKLWKQNSSPMCCPIFHKFLFIFLEES